MNERWNKMYRRLEPHELPWYGLPLLEKIGPLLKDFDKSELLIVTGCGVGDTVKALYDFGFTQIIGTDISSEAIKIATSRFPSLNFRCCASENLSSAIARVNVVDWLNIHQVGSVEQYLASLDIVSNNLVIAYFSDPSKPTKQKSIVHEGVIYNHQSEKVRRLLPLHAKVDEAVFILGSNPAYAVSKQFRTVAQKYVRFNI